MKYIVFSLYLYLLIFSAAYFFDYTQGNMRPAFKPQKWAPILIILFALLVRILPALLTEGYSTDMNCWRAWSSKMFTNGPVHFYSDNYFCDYPPGYLYILSGIGFIRQVFSSIPDALDILIIKMPAILFDVCVCYALYQKALENNICGKTALITAFLYACNPATIVNSAIWGQVDAVFTLFLILSLIYLVKENFTRSAIFFAVSVVIKPQSLLFSPLFLITIWQKRNIPNFSRLLLRSVLSFAGVFLLFVLPFCIGKSPLFIFDLYKKTLTSYPYASLNAFNFYTLIGANGTPLEAVFAGLTYKVWGILGISFSVLLGGFIFYKGKDASRYFFAAALTMAGLFMFGTKMHERYLFPVIPLLFFAYLYRKDNRIIATAGIFSILHFVNVAYLYALNTKNIFYAMPPDSVASLVSFLHLVGFAYMIYLGFSLYTQIPAPSFLHEKKESRLSVRDYLIISVVTILYTFLAFTNLGNTSAPKTVASPDNTADFGESRQIHSVSVYKGIGDCILYFEFSEDNQNWDNFYSFVGSDCFKWENYPLEAKGRYARVRFTGKADAVYEAAFWDEHGKQIPLTSQSPLFDEQNFAEHSINYMNSTYFDEIYHARTAYEHIEYIPHYETTHPPLGKHIIGLGIRMFGMNPFGWRFMGTIFGIMMLPLMYIFAKRLFKSTFFASAAMLLLTFDFMHFTQTRIATIDSYPVFFIMLMYYFMYLFYERAESLPLRKVLLYLCLSGISFGLAISSKWIGFYGGAGLAILFFIGLGKRVRKKNAKELLICLPCLLFFIIIPFIIYYINYLPILTADGSVDFWKDFWNYQKHMFSYHSQLEEGHPFSSLWYTWPFVKRPIWFYGNLSLASEGKVSSIVSMGNPLIWWTSFVAIIACLLFTVYGLIRKKQDRCPLFLGLAYISQYTPWILVSRAVFIYHYFASLPFAILGLVYMFKKICERWIWGKRAVCIFLFLSGILFLQFYPILSGAIVPRNYMISCLTWFGTWALGY